MAEFQLAVKGEGVAMTPAQAEAIMKFGSETGGTIEVYADQGGVVRVVAKGQEFFYAPDGSVSRAS
jgi:hypothetical protein